MAQRQFRSDDTSKWLYGFGNGSDGNYSSAGNATDAPVDSSCSGTSGTTSLSATNASFANGKPILIHQTRGTGAGAWELNKIASYTAGTITLAHALMNTYTDSGASQAQVIQLKQYNNFTQNSGHTLTAKAWNGNVGGIIAFLAKGTVTITGTLSVIGSAGSAVNNGTVAGGAAGGFQGGTGISEVDAIARTGESATGDELRQTSANGTGGGAGANGGSAGGGGGGHATPGAAGIKRGDATVIPGAAGGTGGLANLTNMIFGGAGGGGRANTNTNEYASSGSSSGGIVLIIGKTITVSGLVTVNGHGGSHYTHTFDAPGGAGAGGSILIKAETATLGTNKLTAAGGPTNTCTTEARGGAGGVGRIHLDYKTSYTGTTNPTLDATQDLTLSLASSGFLALL